MRWFWSFLSSYLRADVKPSRDRLLEELRWEAMRRLNEVERIIFSTRIPEEEKLPLLRKRFSQAGDLSSPDE